MKFLPRLEQFRSERRLTEYNHHSFMRMVNEELQEVLDAKTWNHRIEEMCDVCVLCFNAMAQNGTSQELSVKVYHQYKSIDDAVQDVRLDIHNDNLHFAISDMRDCITLNGYDFELAMIETCKKILSRTGEMNSKTGKWTKHKLQANPYTPDYESCKLN